MHKLFVQLFYSLISLLFFIPSIAPAQKKQEIKPKSSNQNFSLFISANYFGPALTDINAVYKTIEKNYLLHSGNDFNNIFTIVAGMEYTFSMRQSVQGEFGFGLMKTNKGASTNYLQLYSVGSTYMYSVPIIGMVSINGGFGVGHMWINTQRDYKSNAGKAYVNAKLAEVHVLLDIEYVNPNGVSFAVEGRYLFSTSLYPERSNLDFSANGIIGGIRVGIPFTI
jgi:hypothetical protein